MKMANLERVQVAHPQEEDARQWRLASLPPVHQMTEPQVIHTGYKSAQVRIEGSHKFHRNVSL